MIATPPTASVPVVTHTYRASLTQLGWAAVAAIRAQRREEPQDDEPEAA